MDVLEMLPLDIVHEDIWQILQQQNVPYKASGSTSSLKLTCRQARLLVDALTSACTCGFSPPSPSLAATVAQQCLAAFAPRLHRLPQLQTLTLQGWGADLYLSERLQQCGTATQGRIRQLTITHTHPLSIQSLSAVFRAFSMLRILHISSPPDTKTLQQLGRHLPQLQQPPFECIHLKKVGLPNEEVGTV